MPCERTRELGLGELFSTVRGNGMSTGEAVREVAAPSVREVAAPSVRQENLRAAALTPCASRALGTEAADAVRPDPTSSFCGGVFRYVPCLRSTRSVESVGDCPDEPAGEQLGSPLLTSRAESKPGAGRHAFFVIGAPTTQTAKDFKAAFDRHGQALTLFVEADLKTYMKEISRPGPNVYAIPTNLRAPYQYRPGVPGEASQPIVLETTKLDSFPAFMECQHMVSQSVREILEFARANGVRTFFPIVARKQRPTHIQVSPEGDRVVALPPDTGPRASHPGSDQELSEFALKVLVEPASAKAGRVLLDDLKRCTDHNATYLADVLAIVGAARLADSDKWWERWRLASCEVRGDGTHSKVVFGNKRATEAAENVPYCKAEFVPDAGGLFYSMDSTAKDFDKSEFNEAVREMLESHASGSPTPVWDTCYVAHDSFALDVDDLPALELAKAVTKPGGFRDTITWRESHLYEHKHPQPQMSQAVGELAVQLPAPGAGA